MYVPPFLQSILLGTFEMSSTRRILSEPAPKCQSIIFGYLLIGGTRINKWFHAQAYRRCCSMGTHPTPLVWEWELWELWELTFGGRGIGKEPMGEEDEHANKMSSKP